MNALIKSSIEYFIQVLFDVKIKNSMLQQYVISDFHLKHSVFSIEMQALLIRVQFFGTRVSSQPEWCMVYFITIIHILLI